METEIEKLVVTMIKEDQEEDKEISGFLSLYISGQDASLWMNFSAAASLLKLSAAVSR
ncbi:hypothetical protein F2Q69_00020495 [Brassica cretica]|uniref:Uncharacterized protein n=1 Tax=Brassica cretica TaxID=69181 RepID=A0A8S9Q3V6_BRACR|nr:hypothetical protein F2Q69_00020495 [Brassica cretica]